MKDLALQDIQKNIVKANQALMVTLERVIKAKDKKAKIDPSSILPQLSDMLNVLGNAFFLTSLKRRDDLSPHINKSFQSVCSKSTKITTLLLAMTLLNRLRILVKSIKFQGKSHSEVLVLNQVALAQMGKLSALPVFYPKSYKFFCIRISSCSV